MPNKFHRQNFRMGSNPFARKSNLQKIAEVFGPKKKDKKVKKPTKRMMANVGGGADTGRIGEMKSKLAVLSDKVKKDLKKITQHSDEQKNTKVEKHSNFEKEVLIKPNLITVSAT